MKNGIVENVKLNQYKIAFINWQNITKIQIGSTQIKSLLITPTLITPLIFNVNMDTNDFPLDINNVTSTLLLCVQNIHE